MAPRPAFRFGPFELDPATFRLRSLRGDAVLSPRATDLLLMFVQQPARLFTKEEIFRALWPGVAVTDNALTQVISEIRRTLGDTPESARYVQTLARRGYRFVAPVTLAMPVETIAAELPTHVAGEVPVTRRPNVRSIRVLDFVNVSRDRPLAWLSTGIAETVTHELRSLPDLRVIDRCGDASVWVDVGSDWVVVGAFQRLGDQLRITARVVDARTREAIACAMVDGARQGAFSLEDALAQQLVASLTAVQASEASRRLPLGLPRPRSARARSRA
jgi:DNA-binding winged helix-turn-helix (wHTH) protein